MGGRDQPGKRMTLLLFYFSVWFLFMRGTYFAVAGLFPFGPRRGRAAEDKRK